MAFVRLIAPTCLLPRPLSNKINIPNKGQEACHVFKFVCRESLDPNIEVHNAFSGIEESPRDVVLLVKPFMGSEEWAQVPEVCFPFACLNYLVELPYLANLLPRGSLTQRQSHEFLRTAQLVEQTPWKLDRAAEYLRTFVSNSAHGSARLPFDRH